MALSAADILDVRRFGGYKMVADPPDAMGAALVLLTPEAETIVETVYLPNLRLLESDIPLVRENADTKKVAVFERNPGEFAERQFLLWDWQRRLCGFLGVALGPWVVPPGSAIAPAAFVV